MKKVGITGCIGSGKTYISSILEKLGFPVFDADFHAKQCMRNNSVIYQIKNIFGEEAYMEGVLQKEFLAKIVFSNSEKLAQLNKIIHPLVKDSFIQWCDSISADIVFKESALLFESNAYVDLDMVVCVICPKEICLNRVIKRDMITKEDVLRRMKNQFSDSKKKKLSDYVILNDNKELLMPQIIDMLTAIGVKINIE